MQKKTIKIKVCDLKPAKDAIGGRHRRHGHHGHQSTAMSEKDGPGVQNRDSSLGTHMVQ